VLASLQRRGTALSRMGRAERKNGHSLGVVLAVVDPEARSSAALAAAVSIARLAAAELHVVSVVPPRTPSHEETAEREQARADLQRRVQSVLGDVADLEGADVIARGSAHEGILDVARAAAADLIVLGSNARAAAVRIGSTADRVLRTTTVPCLVVRSEPHLPLRSAAVLTDYSSNAHLALRTALAWLPALGLDAPESRLDVVHVAWPETPADAGGPPAWMVDRVQQEIDQALRGVRTRPHSVRPHILFSAYPGDAAVEEALARSWDLIVTGTHGRTGLARALLGSVALQLIQSSPCSVLVVPRGRGRSVRR
jgi:nucleotide-binding universal stress UspA family protein